MEKIKKDENIDKASLKNKAPELDGKVELDEKELDEVAGGKIRTSNPYKPKEED